MAKTDATRGRKRKSKGVTKEVIEEENNADTGEQIVGKEDVTPAESTEVKGEEEENQDEQDSQMDTVIEVKGSKSTVSVSWDKKNEEGEADDSENRTSASDQMMDDEEQIGSLADAEDTADEGTETNVKQEMQESEESQLDIVAGNGGKPAVTVAVTWEKKKGEGASSDVKEEIVNGKRKAHSTAEASLSKKPKLINDGFCLFVGNLNNSKTFAEVKDSLAKYFMTQSLLVQDIRLKRSKKHAYVDLASEMDLTKALTLDGEVILDKPLRVAKAKVKSEDMMKVKATAEEKKAARDARCLFLKNVPYKATKEDIMKIFRNAVDVRFPDGAAGPKKGIAFVEFKNEATAKKILQKKRVAKIQDRVLIVDLVGEANRPQAKTTRETTDEKETEAAAPPNNTLFVRNLSNRVKENNLKSVFQAAVSITIPKTKGKPRGYAFVEFATVADAEKAFQSSQNMKVSKKEIKIEFYKMREKTEKPKVLSKTLIVMGLAEKTTAETLQSAFEGALSARVVADKETGVSRGFGFVEFESDESCKAVKEAMEDCEIDGSKVTVKYAKAKDEKAPPGARGGSPGGGRGGTQATGQRAARGGGSRGGRGRGGGKAAK